MEVIIPKFKRGEHPSGVYKFTINDKWFYIGSSKNLKSRMSRWACVIRAKDVVLIKNCNIKSLLGGVEKLEFVVIEECSNFKEREIQITNKHIFSPYILNRHTTYSSSPMIIPTVITTPPINKKKIKPKKPINEALLPKKVARFDMDWNLIEIHPSLRDAGRAISCRSTKITNFLNGKGHQVKGHKFKLVSIDGSFIPINPKVKRKPKRGFPKFYKFDKNGNVLKVFDVSIREAAKQEGVNNTYLALHLKRRPHYNTVKGYVYRYASSIT